MHTCLLLPPAPPAILLAMRLMTSCALGEWRMPATDPRKCLMEPSEELPGLPDDSS